MTIKLTEDTMCAHDLHELTRYPRPGFRAKPALPKGTRLKVKEEWMNFYGSYYRCMHENGEYDIPVGKVLVVNDD